MTRNIKIYKMQTLIIGKLALAGLLMACSGKADLKPIPKDTTVVDGGKPTDKGWTFETSPHWADEFDYSGAPDPAKWGYDLGGSGWGNNELQNYTNNLSNSSVNNGILTINARKENSGTNGYSSARLVSKGKGDFLYGRFEIRAKIPSGRGTWPALWMLPTDNSYGTWPKSGEIDIMEHVGYDPTNIHVTVHTEAFNGMINTQKGASKKFPKAFDDYQLYRLDWTPYAIRGYIQNELIFEFINNGTGYAAWPFDKRFHLLMNVAVGGNWGGAQGVDDSVFPKAMEVDYVRVYKMVAK